MTKSSSVPSSALRRILLATADAQLRQILAAQLREFDIEVFAAEDDRIAVTQFCRQSFPVIICDCKSNPHDTAELIRRARCVAVEPVYIIAVTNHGTPAEMDEMYRAGVDQLVPRTVPKKLLHERIQIAFKAISLRRISRVVCSSDIVTVDLASGAHTARHLVGRLAAEIDLACQTSGTLEIAMVRIGSAHSDTTVSEDLVAVLEAVQTSLRPHVDWVAWLHMVGHSHRLAAVIPNPGHLGATALAQHVRNAFAFETARELPDLAFGHVSFRSQSKATDMTALALLAKAELELRSIDLPHVSPAATGISAAV